MRCFICNTVVSDKKALGRHLQQSKDCQDEIDARTIANAIKYGVVESEEDLDTYPDPLLRRVEVARRYKPFF